MRTITRCVVCVFVSLIAMSARAVQLGDIQGRFIIGQTLDAHIEILSGIADGASVVITTDPRYGVDGEMNAIVSRLHGEVIEEQSGTYIRLTSPLPVSEPVLAFRLTYHAPDVSLSRNYSIALTKPPPPQAQRVRATMRTPINDADVQALGPDGPRYGPVQPNETLWRIARSISLNTGGSINTLMRQIVAANPAAFINGDMNRLKVGAMLLLPATAMLAAQAPCPVSEQQAAVRESALPATPVQTDVAQIRESSAATESEALPEAAPIDWRAADPEFAAKLRRLEDKFAVIRARYTAQAAAPAGTLAVSAPAAVATEPVAIIDAAEPVAVAAVAVPGNKPEAKVSAVAETAAGGTPARAIPVRLIVLAGIGFLLGLYGFRFVRSKLQVVTKHVQSRLHSDQEADRKQEVARKAAHRVELESEVKRIMDEHTRTKALMREAGMATAEAASQYDNLTEIDLSITHGRYQRAEILLRDVIREAPRNFDAKLRLAEVYYITERTADFITIARDLRDHHRNDLADEDWQKVVRMGKVICPDDSLFGRLSTVRSQPIAS